jgi:hypothetical protein
MGPEYGQKTEHRYKIEKKRHAKIVSAFPHHQAEDHTEQTQPCQDNNLSTLLHTFAYPEFPDHTGFSA